MVSKSKVKWLQWIKNINGFSRGAEFFIGVFGSIPDHTSCVVWFVTYWIVKLIYILSSIILYGADLQRFIINYKKS
jgi:hypothetical protein